MRAGGRLATARLFSVKAGRAARLTLHLGPRARKARTISVSAPDALTRSYRLRRC